MVVVIVPDPQYLAAQSTACSMYDRMIQWAVDNKNLVVNGAPLNIKGFIQVGDCQDVALAKSSNSQETVAVNAWSRATAANLFVAWCCGNHDYEINGNGVDRNKIGHAWRTDTNGAWSPANLARKFGGGIDLGSGDFAIWGGVYTDPVFPESSANNYIRLQVGPRKILILSLEFYPRSAVLNWAKGLHDTYADHEVWVTTHGYMDTQGNRCDRTSQYGPAAYTLADAPSSNSGGQMWGGGDPSWAGFTTWPRLGLVTCGHWIDGYDTGWVWQRRQDLGAARQTTLQILCNAQNADMIGACNSSSPNGATDVAHLMLLRVWPTTCEAYMVSTNTGKWTGARGVRSSATPVALFTESFAPVTSSVQSRVAIGGVSNSATGLPFVASGSWVSIYGTDLSVSTKQWQTSDFFGTNLPMSLDGVSVKINGKNAAVYFISPGQINVQAPTDATAGPVDLLVTNSNGSAAATVILQPYAPGFFTFQNKYAAAVHLDGVYVAPEGYFGAGAASRPAKPGETLMIFGTGFGPTNRKCRPGKS